MQSKNSRWLVGGFALSGLYLVITLCLYLLAQAEIAASGGGGMSGVGFGIILGFIDLPGTLITYPFTFLWRGFYDANILLSFLPFLRAFTVALGSDFFYFLLGAFLFGGSPSRWDRSKYSVGTVLVVILASTFVLWLFLWVLSHSVLQNNTSTNCDSYTEEAARNNCFTHLALLNKDPSLCKEYSCFENLADLGDESLCTKMPDQDIQNVCYAIAKKDENLCPSGGAHRDQCFHFVAQKKRDKSVCEKISDEFNRTQCEQNYNK